VLVLYEIRSLKHKFMDKKTSKLIETLSRLTLSESLELLEKAINSKNPLLIERMKKAISFTHQKTPTVIFNETNKNIEVEYKDEKTRKKILISRSCARNIIERLDDIGDIKNLNDIKVIVEQQIHLSEASLDEIFP